MTSGWIPAPVAVVWSVLFVVALVVHVWHAGVMGGRHRLWHLGHVLMAAGMVVMFWSAGSTMEVPAGVGVVVYLAAAGFLAASLVMARASGAMLGPLWLVSVADLAWMAYMFAMMGSRLVWLSVLGVIWFAVQALGWAGGRLGRVLEGRGLGDPGPVTPGSAALVGQRTDSGAAEPTGSTEPGATGRVRHAVGSSSGQEVIADIEAGRLAGVVDGGRRDWSVRLSLTVMGVGMAYMLLAMPFGMAPMSGGAGGMPGM